MTTTVRILGSRAREQMPGTSITLHAPGFRGSLTQLTPGVENRAVHDLPFAEAAACADVILAAQLSLELEARSEPHVPGLGRLPLRRRSAGVAHPRVIVPRRAGVNYALLQTDETGVSTFLSPMPGDDTEAVFLLSIAAQGTRRTLRVLMWPDLPPSGPGPSAVVSRWERFRRPHQLAQRVLDGFWQPPELRALATGAVLLLLPDTFSTPQATFADWIDDESFLPVAQRYQGRCLAFTHPTLATGIGENMDWLLAQLATLPGPFDIVAHGRGGLLARALAMDGRLRLRRVCQVGAPNKGTLLARESHLPRFLDGHVAMLATTPKVVSQGTLEGVLCLARCVAQGLRVSLPGMAALTPDSNARIAADFHVAGLEWFTVGAQFSLPPAVGRDLPDADDFRATPNDLVVPAQGCHEPGIPVNDSLLLAGSDVHHHNYFANAEVRARLAGWL
jgi:hypothetical protein